MAQKLSIKSMQVRRYTRSHKKFMGDVHFERDTHQLKFTTYHWILFIQLALWT